MTRLDPILEIALESARVAREPSSADRARNLAALEARLGLEPALPVADPGGGARPVAGGEALSWGSLKWKLVSLAAVTATAGFLIGLEVGRRASSVEQVTSAVQTSAAPAPASVHPAGAVNPPPVNPPPVNPPPVNPPPVNPPPVSEPRRVLPARARHREPSPPAASVDHTFLAALRLLQRAQRALEGGDAPFAMSLLDELDARYPARLLGEERQVTRALAWCALGDELQATRVGGSLLRDNPGSIYATRLARSCVRAGSGKAAER